MKIIVYQKQEKIDLEKNWKHDEKIHKSIQELKKNIQKLRRS